MPANSFDSSAIGSIGSSSSSVADSFLKAYKLNDLIQEGQLNTLRLKDYQKDQADRAAVKEIISKGDLSTQEGVNAVVEKLSKAGYSDEAMRFHQQAGAARLQDLDTQLKTIDVQRGKLELGAQRLDELYSYVGPITDALRAKGVVPGQPQRPEVEAAVRTEVKNKLMALRERWSADPEHKDMIPHLDRLLADPSMLGVEGVFKIYDRSVQGKQDLAAKKAELENLKIKAEAEATGKKVVTTEEEVTAPITGAVSKKPHISIVDTTTGKVTDTGAEAAKNTAPAGGGRDAVFTGRIISAGHEIVGDLQNLMELPTGSRTGWLGKPTKGGVMEGVVSGLANSLTSQEAQNYMVMVTGIQRNLSAVEATGLAPQGSLTGQMEGVIIKPGDSRETAMRKMAQIRQITVNGIEFILHKPNISDEQKAEVRGIRDALIKAVPFTQHDITLWKKNGKPGQTFGDFVRSQTGGTPATTSSGATVSDW
jgi:hypothetical protein